ncbi:hypothetical protein UPYG_G00234740 [Umbra pygmaea]|uniref:Ataxin-2 C-terminal domain-containing protein n=1 Tax=Umbra pygmaea TaxID=75934 RepID=A0ABD0WE36_UMBPY
MSGPEVAKTPGGGAPGKDGKEPVANGHAGEGEQGVDNPFAEYMWMENEDAYNRQVEEELLEQEFLERCFQEMLDEEDQDWFIPARDLPSGVGQIQQQFNGLSVNDGGNAEEMARKSNLNPDAKEFIPEIQVGFFGVGYADEEVDYKGNSLCKHVRSVKQPGCMG